jgi:hypothetical protein
MIEIKKMVDFPNFRISGPNPRFGRSTPCGPYSDEKDTWDREKGKGERV